MPTGRDDTPAAGSPIRTVGSTNTIVARKQFLQDVFKKSEKLQTIEERHLNALSDDEIEALYGICTTGLKPEEDLHTFLLEDIAKRVEKIKEAGDIIFHLERGNPLTRPFREFITAARRIDNTQDAAVRLGTTLEAIGALAEGLGKLAKTAGKFIQKNPKAFAAITAVMGVAIPVLWPASASVVTGIAVGVAVIEMVGFGIKKWKQHKAKRAKQAQEALAAVAEANPELAAQVTVDLTPEARAAVTAHTGIPIEPAMQSKAEQISEILGKGIYPSAIISSALGNGALEKIDINMLKTSLHYTTVADNKQALKLICGFAKEMPKTKDKATLVADGMITAMVEEFAAKSPSINESALAAFKDDLKANLKPELVTALQPSISAKSTLEKVMKATEACAEYQSSINTAGRASRVEQQKLQNNIVKEIASKEFSNLLQAAEKAPIIEKMTSRANAEKIKRISNKISRERGGRTR